MWLRRLTKQSISRKFRRSRKLRRLVSWLFICYIKLCRLTCNIEVIGQDRLDDLTCSTSTTGVLFAAWHGHILTTPLLNLPDNRAKYGLISDNRDGEIIAQTLQAFGITAIRGSSRNIRKTSKDKGGAEAAAKVRKVLNDGAFVGITPDGPRGPLHKAQPGVAALSLFTQVPVLPLALSSKNCLKLDSWDRFLIIIPFFRVRIFVGDPVYPSINTSTDHTPDVVETYRLKIEDALSKVNQHAF